MKRLCLAFLFITLAHSLVAAQALSGWSFRSAVTTAQRLKDIDRVVKTLQLAGKKDKNALKAAQILKNEAYICEPLGSSPNRGEAYRVIRTPAHGSKQGIGVMPIYPFDESASPSIAEALKIPAQNAGAYNPTSQLTYLLVTRLDNKNAVKSIAQTILGAEARRKRSQFKSTGATRPTLGLPGVASKKIP